MPTYQSLKNKSIQFETKKPIAKITQKLLSLRNVKQKRKKD